MTSSRQRQGPILMEIVGATNLTPASASGAAAAGQSGTSSSPTARAQIQRTPSELLNPLTAVGTVSTSLTNVGGSLISVGGNLLNATGVLGRREASCSVKVICDGEKVHKTEVIGNTNNPIWTVESGSLFLLGSSGGDSTDATADGNQGPKTLLLELRDQSALVPGKTVSIGTVRLSVDDIYAKYCTEARLEFPIATDLIAAARDGMLTWSEDSEHGLDATTNDDNVGGLEEEANKGGNKPKGSDADETKQVDDDAPTLALRFRRATPDDVRFMSNLKAGRLDVIAQDNYGIAASAMTAISAEHTTDDITNEEAAVAKDTPQRRRGSSRKQSSASGTAATSARRTSALLTEEDAANLAASVGGVMDSVKFTLSASQGRGHKMKLRVKPGPDPAREDKTRFLSEEELMAATYSPSKNWVEAGSGRHGKVLIEILHCDGLPNCDPGGSVVGQKTTAFVSVVMDDAVLQTDTVPSCCSPQWMPWTRRAFACNRLHPLSSMYVGVFHYDPINPLGHRGIGRVAINLQQFRPNHVYLLKYNMYNSPVYSDRVPMGSITLRLTIDQPPGTEKALLLQAIKPIPQMHINVKKRKSLAVVKYTCYGQHPEDRFDVAALKSQAQEMMDLAQSTKYTLIDAAKSLVFWRGQVSFGKVKFPLYSMLAYIGGSYVVERPYLIPSLFFWFVAFGMMASYGHRSHHPSPWHRGRPITDFAGAFTKGKIMSSASRIKAGEGAKEAEGLEQARQSRVEFDAVAASKKNEMDRRVSEVEEATDRSKAASGGARVPQIDPMAMLIPVQQNINEAIWFPRIAKSVVCWENSTAAAVMTGGSFAIAILLSILPTTWLIQWFFRILIHLGLGPHMKLVDLFCNSHVDFEDEGDRIKHEQAMMKSLDKAFKSKNKMARIKAEDSIKRNAMRKVRLGHFVAQVPPVNVTRFFDYPLPESTAAPLPTTFSSKTVKGWKDRIVVPGQQLYGSMVPVPRKYADENISAGDEDSVSLGKMDETKENASDDTITQPKEDSIDDMPDTTNTTDDLQKLAEFNFQLAQAKAELDMSHLESRRANDERDDVKEKLAEKEKEVDRLQRLVEEMTQVSSRGGQLVDTAKDDSNASSIHNESITIDDNIEPAEELSATDEISPNVEEAAESKVPLADEDHSVPQSDEAVPDAEDEAIVRESHESKETLLVDLEDEPSSSVATPSHSVEHLQQRSSFTFGTGDDSLLTEDQLYEVGLDEEDDGNLDPFATYDASARSTMSGSGDTGSNSEEAKPREAVKSPLKRFMQNRRKNEESD